MSDKNTETQDLASEKDKKNTKPIFKPRSGLNHGGFGQQGGGFRRGGGRGFAPNNTRRASGRKV